MQRTEIRRGAYYDSVILMHLQRALLALPGIDDSAVMMGTEANKEMLQQSDLLTTEATGAGADDLIIVVSSAGEADAESAIAQVDDLINLRRATNLGSGADGDQLGEQLSDYRPKSLQSAVQSTPAAQWVLISVPGRYATEVAKEALRLEKNVFLYSDNVSIEDELALKQVASEKGLLVMGPDCGTAVINGVGLGFANQVRRGKIGVIGASGTGLQHVTARIHQLGGGITHALGTGGRDLSEPVHAVTTRQALDLLNRDLATSVIVLVSKPPAEPVAEQLIHTAALSNKPVIINFIGYNPKTSGLAGHQPEQTGNLYFCQTLDATARLAIQLAGQQSADQSSTSVDTPPNLDLSHQPTQLSNGPYYLRGLYSGGTLAYEAQLLLQEYIPAVYANAPLNKRFGLERITESIEHTILDLGEDDFTVGRLHPMMDNEVRIKRLQQEAEDPSVALILLDMVLGHGAHPDPASELAPAIAQAIDTAQQMGRTLQIVTVVVGTNEDPQNMAQQIQQLQDAGAKVELDHEEAIRSIGRQLQAQGRLTTLPPVDLAVLNEPVIALNVGLESFTESLVVQQTQVTHVDWRPSAGGNARLAGILSRMKSQ
ncbi:MAG: acyl-CoA synthetase FdrA [Chloroflexota bacterium]